MLPPAAALNLEIPLADTALHLSAACTELRALYLDGTGVSGDVGALAACYGW